MSVAFLAASGERKCGTVFNKGRKDPKEADPTFRRPHGHVNGHDICHTSIRRNHIAPSNPDIQGARTKRAKDTFVFVADECRCQPLTSGRR